jgi:hypothetical protein
MSIALNTIRPLANCAARVVTTKPDHPEITAQLEKLHRLAYDVFPNLAHYAVQIGGAWPENGNLADVKGSRNHWPAIAHAVFFLLALQHYIVGDLKEAGPLENVQRGLVSLMYAMLDAIMEEEQLEPDVFWSMIISDPEIIKESVRCYHVRYMQHRDHLARKHVPI